MNAIADLIERLKDPAIAARAQTAIFSRLGNDFRGQPLTTASFVKLSRTRRGSSTASRRPTVSMSCWGRWRRTGTLDSGVLRLFGNKQVRDFFYSFPGDSALARLESEPLLVFFRPSAIGFPNSGKNKGNEASIFHEALHGITGLEDPAIKALLSLPASDPSCRIGLEIIWKVLDFSQPPLDPLAAGV